jgi:hypothetical protein
MLSYNWRNDSYLSYYTGNLSTNLLTRVKLTTIGATQAVYSQPKYGPRIHGPCQLVNRHLNVSLEHQYIFEKH